jgi:hypothetical protein
VDAEAARLAEPTRPFLRRVIALENPLRRAALTVGVVTVRGETPAPDVLKTRLVVGVLAEELKDVARRFRRRSTDRVKAVNRGHQTLLVGKSASPVATVGALAFGLSKPNLTGAVGRC